MILFKVPLVIPTHALWLAMLFVVGILGLTGQVCHLVPVPLPHCLTQILIKALLTMGLQRETAGRGTLAIYSSVCFSAHTIVRVLAVNFATDYLRRYVRLHLLSHHAFGSLDHRDVDHRELGYLYHRRLSHTSFSFRHLVLTFPRS